MRIFQILAAAVVVGVLYIVVMERDLLTGGAPEEEVEVARAETVTDAPSLDTSDAVRVLAMRSVAKVVDSQVVTRGETEAMRQIEVRAEVDGKVISEPLRRGTFVEAGQMLCEIDPGTRLVSLAEAEAVLAEARARLPEARARIIEARAQVPATEATILQAQAGVPAADASLLQAQAGVPAAEARLIEAKARVPEAAARLAEARARVPAGEAALLEAETRIPEAEARLREAMAGVPAAEASLRQAEANVPAAQAALAEALTRAPEAEARVLEAEARLREAEINLNAAQRLSAEGFAAQTRLASAEAAYESAKAQVQTALAGLKGAASAAESARGQVEGAKAQVEAAKSQIESAHAAVQSAQSQIANAKSGVEAARSSLESAHAGVQAAQSGVENAKAGIETAHSDIEGAKAGVEQALSQVTGAKAQVASTEASRETVSAVIEGALAGEENALASIQSAEATVARALKEIERLKIYAPFAGVLETDTAELGALLQPGSACATILQLKPIKFVGYVTEDDVSRVDLGANASARLADGRIVNGPVEFVSRNADPVTRTFRVEMHVENEDLAIRSGQTAEILVDVPGVPAHLLPQSTLTLNNEGTLGVRSVNVDNTALFLPVTYLRDTREGVVVSGLPDEVNLITLGQEYVTDGVPVDPVYEEILQ